MPLEDGQYQLGQVTFGTGTWLPVQDPPDWGATDLTINDVPRPGGDGIRMGRESRQGRTLGFSIGVLGSGTHQPGGIAMMDRLTALEAEWANDDDRRYASILKPLYYSRAGVTRMVWGRPRKFAATAPDTGSSFVNVTADYQTIDHYSYSEDLYFTVVGTVALSRAGVRFPVRFPMRFVQSGIDYYLNPIRVQGTAPAWPAMYFFGPCTNPVVEFVGQFKVALNITLKSDEWVVVDPAPWAQLVRRSDLANLAGAFTWDTPRLSQMKLQPGTWRVTYSAGDRTATSVVYVLWRSTFHGM